MFTLSAPFPGHANAVIVTPTPLKADVVITPHLGGVCVNLPLLFYTYTTVVIEIYSCQ